MQRGTNLERLGGYNQAVVLESIRHATEGVSRVELAASTGLSPQTISNVVRRLLDDGWVREAGTVISGPGKPRTLIQLVDDRQVSVGIHMDPYMLSCVIVDLRGKVLHGRRGTLPGTGSPEETLTHIASLVNSLIDESGYARDRVLGVGLAMPGPVDEQRGGVVAPPLLPGWGEVDIVGPLSEALGLEIRMAKDTVAAATAELWVGAGQELGDFVSVYVGTGVGVGLVSNGVVLTGRTGNAGEFGHLLVASSVPDACRVCGRHDCLAINVNFDTIARRGREAGLEIEPPSPELHARIAASEGVIELARRGEPAAVEIALDLSHSVASVLAHVASLLDFDQVVMCGPAWELLKDIALAPVHERLNEGFLGTLPREVQVTSSQLGGRIAALGGACLVLEGFLAPKTSGLLLR